MNKLDLIERITEAHDVLRRLPDPDRKFRFPKLASWPLFVRDMAEAYGYGEVKVRLAQPSPEAIDRADEVLGWFATHLNQYPKGAKACWLTYGRGLSLREAGKVMRLKKSHVARLRETALKLLTRCLSSPRKKAA